MKIVIIPSADLSYNSGSVIYAKELFKYLLNEGHEVYMLGICVPEDINEEYKANIKVKKNLLFHPIIDDRPIENIQHLKMGEGILEALTEIYEEWGKIDIIHAHYASINSYMAVIFKKFINTSVVVSSFGRDLNIGYELGGILEEFIEYSYQNADKIIVSDSMMKNKVTDMFCWINGDKIDICPMPLDEKVLAKGDFVNGDKNEVVISTINSCFTPEKGIDGIILAFSKVVKKHGNCKLYIAGQDDDDNNVNYLRLQNLVEQLGLKNEVVFTDYLSREDVGRLLNSTDVFIDARMKGNFSSVLLEAEFKHKVIIASNNEASKKIITNGVNGLLFEIGNISELEEKILFILENEVIRKELIQGTREWSEGNGKEYTSEICMRKIVEIYKSVIK
uniref:glycosyltransferase family 4 protein n=1 Tax=Eshraghiella crossota TaxID=45851 RepID=UPI00402985CA